MIKIPQQGKFAQTNKGEISGNLYRTQNVDLKTNPGKMRVSPRLVVNTKDNDASITGMGVPLGFVYLASKYWAACGIGTAFGSGGTGKILSGGTTPSTAFTNDAISGTPTDVTAEVSDMVYWNNGNYATNSLGPALLVSTFSSNQSEIKRLYNGTTWFSTWFTSTVSGTFRFSGDPKNMCVGFNGNLYITDWDRIIYVPMPTYQTNINAVLTTAGAANTVAGTVDFNGQYRPIWIRSTSTALWVGLMTFDTTGINNGTKGYVAKWDTTGTAVNNIYDIQAPCALSCTILDDVPYIIDAYGRLKKFDGTGFKEIARLPVANQNIEMPGIYNCMTNTRWIHHRGMDVVDGKININVNNFVSTGVYVEDMPAGVWEYDPDIGLYHKSSPCADTNDWGQQLLLTAGAIAGTKRSTATYLVGNAYYTDSGSTSRNGIFYDDIVNTTSRRGMFITPWLDSSAAQDVFHRVYYRFRKLVSGSKIIGKYRTDKSANLPFFASVSWTGSNSFLSTDANFQYASVGDEVLVVQGKGASTSGHITQINSSGGTYTVITDDTSLNISGGSAKVKINNYRKMGEISQLNSSTQWLSVNKTDNSLMVKTEFRDEGGMELNDTIITSNPQQLAN